jgi:hypothetical protein
MNYTIAKANSCVRIYGVEYLSNGSEFKRQRAASSNGSEPHRRRIHAAKEIRTGRSKRQLIRAPAKS